ncbi:hypothetical protein [Acidovorax sp. BLS4]|uniref:hypothetical protein n=1 Tax=Acidovorax sp. BLS4 TaxID=3273430 RepID=UPI002943D6D6|nr:hypothetical protein [Paracidovorax avenae]WOI45169.1 hypothetical protein R1Z03_22045 [Paracidovorax avenae]
MPESIIDLGILLSLKCSIDALLPNIEEIEKNNINEKARGILKSHKKNPQEILKAPSNQKTLERKISAEVFQNLNQTTLKSLRRYINRLDKGFSHSTQKIPQIELIKKHIECIQNLSGNTSYDDEIIEIICRIEEKNMENSFSIYEGITGSATEPTDQWDEEIVSIFDEEYDHPYIETLAMKLKPACNEFNILYDWKRFLKPIDYEKLRDLFLKSISVKNIEDIILPY